MERGGARTVRATTAAAVGPRPSAEGPGEEEGRGGGGVGRGRKGRERKGTSGRDELGGNTNWEEEKEG